MKIHAVASRPQYARHVAAVWKHLPDTLRGEFRSDPRATGLKLPAGDPVMVGGWHDMPGVRTAPIIYVEHGAGQSYRGDPRAQTRQAYPGGVHSDQVIGYVSPRPDVAALWERPAVVAGCPALDRHAAQCAVRSTERVAAITFHFTAKVCAETRSARPHYLHALPAVVARLRGEGFHVLGHRHPLDADAAKVWAGLGVLMVEDPDVVLERCCLLIADTTSLLYEAAALDRAVIALNAPWYRRGVEHGLRFWSHIPGCQVDDPDELAGFDFAGYVADDPTRDLRRHVAGYTYGGIPVGSGGGIAADWIRDLVSSP